MKFTDWKTVAELTGIAAIVVSLVFVGVQLQQDREFMTVTSFGSVIESNNALSELVQNHSELWVRGLDGGELTDPENAIFISMVQSVEAHYINYLIRWSTEGNEDRNPESLAQRYASFIYMYPGLRKVMEDQAGFSQLRNTVFETAGFGTGSATFLRALPHLRRLDELAPDIPATKTYVIW